MIRTSFSLVSLASTALLVAAPSSAQDTIWTLAGFTVDSYGQVTDVIGDADGDGFAEIAVGAWRDDNGALADAGTVFVYSGATGTILYALQGSGAGDHVGFGSSGAGDSNGDGFYDICVAGDEDDVTGVGSNAGSLQIISGADGVSVLQTWTGTAANDLFGWSTVAAGDVDGDGIDDIVVGALLDEDVGTPGDAGSLTAISGANGTIIHRVYGSVAGGQFGNRVGRAGDLDGDGKAEIMGTQGNRVRIFKGSDGLLLREHTITFGGAAGLHVSGGIDTNGDGFDDYLIGRSGLNGNTGQVEVRSGFDGSLLYAVDGDVAGDALGACVVGVGDIDCDGYGDFAAGMTGSDVAFNNAGGVRAYSGKTGNVISTVYGDDAGYQLGFAIGGGHDVNGDGSPDVAVSSRIRARVKVVSFVPQGLEPFGTGTPGCAGEQSILANSVPAAGNAGFTVFSNHAPPGLPALLAISTAANVAGLPFQGALLHVGLPASFFDVQVTPAADSIGSLAAPVPIPNDPNLVGTTLTFQFATLWPLATCGLELTTSRGLAVTIQ